MATHKDQILSILTSINPKVGSSLNPGDEDNLFDMGVLDSFGILQLLPQLESQFDITLDYNDLDPEKFKDIAAIEAYVGTYTS